MAATSGSLLTHGDTIDVIWRHADRETNATVVVVFLNDAGQQATAADSVTAHDHGLFLPIPIEIHPPTASIARAQLKDVANFDAPYCAQGCRTLRTPVAVTGGNDIRHEGGLIIASVIRVQEMIAVLIRASDQIGGEGDKIIYDNEDAVVWEVNGEA